MLEIYYLNYEFYVFHSDIINQDFYIFTSEFQGDYIWIEPITRREFDVAIGARVISADGRKIQVKNYTFLVLIFKY